MMSFIMKNQLERLTDDTVGKKDRLIRAAIQATTGLLKRWCDGRFISLPSAFSRQMNTYWTPEFQKERYHALALNHGCIEPLAYSDQTLSRVSALYIHIACHYGRPFSVPHYSARIILRTDGRIMAFYI